MPVLTFHGQQDVVNPYLGNGDLRWGYTVPVALQTWATHRRVPARPQRDASERERRPASPTRTAVTAFPSSSIAR